MDPILTDSLATEADLNRLFDSEFDFARERSVTKPASDDENSDEKEDTQSVGNEHDGLAKDDEDEEEDVPINLCTTEEKEDKGKAYQSSDEENENDKSLLGFVFGEHNTKRNKSKQGHH